MDIITKTRYKEKIRHHLKFEYLILFLIIIVSIMFRCYNTGDFSIEEEGSIAYVSSLISDSRVSPFYVELSNEDGLDDDVSITPLAFLLFSVSISVFGKTFFSVKIVSLIFSIISLIIFYFLISKYYGKYVALLSAVLFSLLPFSIILGRIGLLNSMLFALLILIVYLFKKGLDDNDFKYYYIVSFLALIGELTKEYFIVILMVALVPLFIIYYFSKKENRNVFSYNFYHIISSFSLSFIFYLVYLLIPLLWGDPRYLNKFIEIVFHDIKNNLLVYSSSYFYNIYFMIKSLFFTPLLLIILIPTLIGLLISIYRFKEGINSVFVSLLLLIFIEAFFGRDIFGISSFLIFSYILFSSVAITYSYENYIKEPSGDDDSKKNKKKSILKIDVKEILFTFMAFIWLLFLLFIFRFYSEIFEKGWNVFYAKIDNLGISFLYNFFVEYFNIIIGILFAIFITYYMFSRRSVKNKIRVLFAQKTIFIFVFILFAITFIFIGLGFSPDSRSDLKGLGGYLKNNSAESKYSCIAGEEHYALSYYLGKPCLSWKDFDVDKIDSLSKKGDVSVYVLNRDDVTPGFGMEDQHEKQLYAKEEFYIGCKRSNIECDMIYEYNRDHEEKYDWLVSNAEHITLDDVDASDEDIRYDVYVYKK